MATKLISKSAGLGDTFAMIAMGLVIIDAHADQDGEVSNEGYLKAAPWFRQSAELGNAFGMVHLGNLYCEGKGYEIDQSAGIQWYQKAAATGETLGMMKLGYLFQNRSGSPDDEQLAKIWFERAAAAGNHEGLYELAEIYRCGIGLGVKADGAIAVSLYKKAMEAGSKLSILRMGNMYYDGHGVERDLAEAVIWFHRAAEAGVDYAWQELSIAYEFGRGVPRDFELADMYRAKAREAGIAG